MGLGSRGWLDHIQEGAGTVAEAPARAFPLPRPDSPRQDFSGLCQQFSGIDPCSSIAPGLGFLQGKRTNVPLPQGASHSFIFLCGYSNGHSSTAASQHSNLVGIGL